MQTIPGFQGGNERISVAHTTHMDNQLKGVLAVRRQWGMALFKLGSMYVNEQAVLS